MSRFAPLVALAQITDGYPLLVLAVLLSAAGLPLPISALLVAVGVASAQLGLPALLLLCALCTAAAVAGDSLDYLLGRLAATSVGARRLPWVTRLGERLGLRPRRFTSRWRETLLERGAAPGRPGAVLALFTTRFIPPLMPLASPVSVVLGASRFALLPFLIWDLLGEAVFVGGNVAVGRLLSGPLAALEIGPFLLWASLASLTLVPGLIALLRRRRRARTPEDVARLAVASAAPDGRVRELAST
jgi:membrane protein DedA with SNARE-associated domain